MCGDTDRLPRQHKPICKFKCLPFSALVVIWIWFQNYSTISTNLTRFPTPLQLNIVSSTKILTSSSNVESLDTKTIYRAGLKPPISLFFSFMLAQVVFYDAMENLRSFRSKSRQKILIYIQCLNQSIESTGR